MFVFLREKNNLVQISLEYYAGMAELVDASDFEEKNLHIFFKRIIKELLFLNGRGKPITCELHHINGDSTDNRIENLQILCHSLTEKLQK